MLAASDLQPFLSQKPIVLIVEDRMTKEYLIQAWGPDEQFFNILATGGSNTVKGVVVDLRRHGSKAVFGLVDRDFGEANVVDWSRPNDPPIIFRPSFHELENVLLDWPALAGCDLNQRRTSPRTAQEIQQTATDEAKKQPWWLACRKCLGSHQQLMGKDFPNKPKLSDMHGFQPAFDHIANSAWQSDLAARTAQILNKTDLKTALRDAHRQYDQDLTDDRWVQTYSGKEIFNVLLSRIHDVPKTPTSEPDVDLAKSVAKWQFEHSAVPEEIDALRQVLKQRVGAMKA